MRRHIYLVILALVACKSSESAKQEPPKAGAAADPWGAKSDKPVVDPKDPDLSTMVDLATGAPGTLEYPQADAVIAVDRDDVTLKADGTVVEHHKQIVKILDAQRGKEKFADVHVPFDSKRQTLTIDMARTVNPDGKPHTAAADEIGDIVPSRLADATIYSDVRERVVSLPAVDKGSVVELEYTRTTKPTPDAPMGGEQMLGAWDPILDRTVSITAPSSMEPKLAVVGMDLKATESDMANGHVWTYKVTKQPDQHPEREAPPEEAVLPRLVYGFQPSWSNVLDPIAERFLKAAVPATPAAAIKQQADQLVAGAKDDTEKAQKLFAFVSHDVRSVDLPLGWAGYEPHAPEVVLQNRYADDRDKVALLLALASAEGIAGRPVMVRTGHVPVIQSVPTVAQFDRVIAKLSIGGKDVWVDPQDENGQFDVAFAGQDNLVLPIEKGGSELGQRRPLDPSSSVSHVSAKLSLAANGDLDAQYSYELTGWYADQASDQLRPLKGEPLAQFFQHSAAAFAASAIDKGHEVGDTLSVAGPIKVTQHIAAPGYAVDQSGFRAFEMPPVTLDVAEAVPSAGLSTRKYPLWIGTPRIEKGDVSLQVPAGWKVAYVPPKLEGSADAVSYSSECTAAGQTVTCHDEIKLDQLSLPVAKYGAFREALAKLRAYERRVVLLVKA
jgi:hypothetical protein